jgi:hypothetical protein
MAGMFIIGYEKEGKILEPDRRRSQEASAADVDCGSDGSRSHDGLDFLAYLEKLG